MHSNEGIEERVIARINNEIGKDFKKLYRASIVVEHYKERINEISKNVRTLSIGLILHK